MEDLGVNGMIVMPWPILDPNCATVEARVNALEDFASNWIH